MSKMSNTPNVPTNIGASYTNIGQGILVAILPGASSGGTAAEKPVLVYGTVVFPWPTEL